jgi:hypothetical protein
MNVNCRNHVNNYVSEDRLQFGLKLFFFNISVRQNVLERGNHELVWQEKGTFKLTVLMPTDPEEASASKKSRKESPEEVRKPRRDSKGHKVAFQGMWGSQ